ncbi:MAG TPA: hypothetical protein VFL83_11320 [Anaeromyxobacter sp.]|nr:hypothetical protein [Anaeromyxobacter sp.]
MTAAPGARLVVACSLLCAAPARAQDRAGPPEAAPPPDRSAPAGRDVRERPATRGAQDPSRRTPPAVLVVPLVGLVLLPLVLPVAEPRVRRTSPRDASGARPQEAAPAPLPASRAEPPAPASPGAPPPAEAAPAPTSAAGATAEPVASRAPGGRP